MYYLLYPQDILLPDFTSVARRCDMFYKVTRDKMAAYLRAGSDSRLVLHSVVATAALNNQVALYRLALWCRPLAVIQLNLGWLFKVGKETLHTLEAPVQEHIRLLYGVTGGARYRDPCELDVDPHVYWEHFSDWKRVRILDTLHGACVRAVRKWVLRYSGGRSVIARLYRLPVPKSVKATLALDGWEEG